MTVWLNVISVVFVDPAWQNHRSENNLAVRLTLSVTRSDSEEQIAFHCWTTKSDTELLLIVTSWKLCASPSSFSPCRGSHHLIGPGGVHLKKACLRYSTMFRLAGEWLKQPGHAQETRGGGGGGPTDPAEPIQGCIPLFPLVSLSPLFPPPPPSYALTPTEFFCNWRPATSK